MNDTVHQISKNEKIKIDPWKWILIISVILWFLMLVLIPIYGILKETLKNNLHQIISMLTSPTAIHSFWITGLICITVVIINTIFGTILAIVIVKNRFKGKLFLESLMDLPFAVSPVVIGFMLIILFGTSGWLGRILNLLNIKIIYAIPGMIIATLFVTLPFVAKEIIPVLRQFGTEQEEAARVLGASEWQIFWKITLPTIKWGLGYGLTLTIARSIGEFGAVLVVSGSILNKTQSATLFIHDQFTDLNYLGALSASIVLIIISILVIIFIQFTYKRKSRLT